MVDTRLTRQAIEVLFQPGPVVTLPRVSAEALVDPDDGTGSALLTRQGVEVLFTPPAEVVIPRVSAEVLADPDDGTGSVRLARQGVEALYQPPPMVGIPRMSVEVLVDTDTGTGVVQLTRQAIEVLYPRPPASPVPLALPSAYEVFIHDWSDGVSLENAYMTDVTFSGATGAEERRILREKPQRTQTVRYVNTSKEVIDRLMANARRLTAARVPFPLYCDESIGTADSGVGEVDLSLVWCDTTLRRFFIGGRVAIVPHTSDNFVPEALLGIGIIEGIEADHLILEDDLTLSFAEGRFSVYPLIDCEYVLAPAPLFHTHLTVEWDLTVVEILGANTLPATRDGRPLDMPLLEGIPILNMNHDQDFFNGVQVSYVRDGDTFNRGRGSVVSPNDYRYKQNTTWNLLGETRVASWKVVQFLDWARGRGRVFFQMDEEDVWTAISATATFIEIDPLGTFADFEDAFDYVGIEMLDGTIHARKVNTIQDVGSAWRITTVGEDLPALDLTQINRVARVRKSRLKSDASEENWKTLEVCKFRFTTTEVLDEGEETT